MMFSIMTLSIMTLSIMTLSIMTLSIITFSIMTLSIMTLSIMELNIMKLDTKYCYADAESCLYWLSHISPLCWVSLCWVPLCWVPLCWVPLCCVFHFIYRYAECRGAINSSSSVSLSVLLKWFMLQSVGKCAVIALTKNCAQNPSKNWQHLPIFIEIFWMKFTHALWNIYNSKLCFHCQKLTR
jgi:hypothetical protein